MRAALIWGEVKQYSIYYLLLISPKQMARSGDRVPASTHPTTRQIGRWTHFSSRIPAVAWVVIEAIALVNSLHNILLVLPHAPQLLGGVLGGGLEHVATNFSLSYAFPWTLPTAQLSHKNVKGTE